MYLKLDKMEAREFYDKRIKEEPKIGSVQLMEEYAEEQVKNLTIPDVSGLLPELEKKVCHLSTEYAKCHVGRLNEQQMHVREDLIMLSGILRVLKQ